MTRVLHFSDIHVDVPWTRLATPTWHVKRWVGAANLFVRRAKHFREGAERLRGLAEFMHAQQIDLVLCSGDYTTLGTALEMNEARAAIEPFTKAPLGFVTVPGNHDLYLHDSVYERRFEEYFHPFLKSDLPDLQTDGDWPLVRFVNNDIVVIAVNSSRPNPEPWRSSGRISDVQLSALRTILSRPDVQNRFAFVMTHYAPRRRDGSPDTTLHGLENSEEFLEVCKAIHTGAIVHGHIHWPYHLRVDGLAAPIFCAGSATHHGREGCWIYELNAVDPSKSTARLAHWSGSEWELTSHEESFPLLDL